MFDDVPERLTQWVRDVLSKECGVEDRGMLISMAAAAVIFEYAKWDIYATNASFWTDDPLAGGAEAQDDYELRVLMLGRSIFAMRQTAGFQEFCRRLPRDSVRAAYFELLAARCFLRLGFAIEARPEISVRGEDYDFAAVKDSMRVSIEVTALEEKTFYPRTFPNALEQKRKQLPKRHPAFVFCVLPQQWESEVGDLNDFIRDEVKKFFARTTTVNALVLVMEKTFWLNEELKDSRSLTWTMQIYINKNSRHDFDTSILIDGLNERAIWLTSELQSVQQQACLTPTLIADEEFLRWIEYVVPLKDLSE